MAYILTHRKELRNFIPKDFIFNDWNSLQPWFEKLEETEILSAAELRKWLHNWDELSSLLEENMAWRYIHMTCYTTDDKARESYDEYLHNILPNQTLWNEKLQKKYQTCSFRNELTEPEFRILDKSLLNALELFREENIPIQTELFSKAQEFGVISGNMSIELDGQTLTLQQAGVYLEKTDRPLREKVWRKISERRAQDQENLHLLLDELIRLRTLEAKNAGFPSYTEYKFRQMGRFDYSIEDCFSFHTAVENIIKPVYLKLAAERKEKLGLSTLRPWDLNVDIYGDQPLKPFVDGKELTEKSIEVFSRIRPDLADMIRTMEKMNHLDLESRPGKAPGGYNHPLAESGVPFIFMNAAGTHDDMTTMMHEAGHAFHSFLTHTLELNDFKNTPSEIAELASMSMELISSRYWSVFYPDAEELRRARLDHLGQALSILAWVATIDAFQHWLYAHPGHSHTERETAWLDCYHRFQGNAIDWTDLNNAQKLMWQKQMHIFEVPFYYIEYGLAQLGALGVWKNYLEDPDKALDQYLSALKLGYTRSIPEVYETAGIKFDFSEDHIKNIIAFGMSELQKLN